MGKHLTVGNTYTEYISVESNTPVNFFYNIEVLKAHPDISIEPMSGDIQGNQETLIEIQYRPSTYTTAECEIQFRTSEFDMTPKLCRIVGNALPNRQNIEKTKENGGAPVVESQQPPEEYEVKKTKTRTLLTNKKEAMRTSSRAGVRLEKIPDGSLSTKAGGSKALSVDPRADAVPG